MPYRTSARITTCPPNGCCSAKAKCSNNGIRPIQPPIKENRLVRHHGTPVLRRRGIRIFNPVFHQPQKLEPEKEQGIARGTLLRGHQQVPCRRRIACDGTVRETAPGRCRDQQQHVEKDIRRRNRNDYPLQAYRKRDRAAALNR